VNFKFLNDSRISVTLCPGYEVIFEILLIISTTANALLVYPDTETSGKRGPFLRIRQVKGPYWEVLNRQKKIAERVWF
jgi:hypothetical protein